MSAHPSSIGPYAILRQLGAGGMGVVYEALDRQSGRRAALKTMRAPSGEALLRFKNEFRALADIQHPNLVSLGELVMESGQWWFTMELVRGVNLLTYVRPAALAAPSDTEEIAAALAPTSDPTESCEALALSLEQSEAYREGWQGVQIERLRCTLIQLVEGLHALHLANKVHRDVKPENVMVTAEGRVVILDFGLVGELRERDSMIVGTVAYMAPEQALRAPVGPPTDWYSVGALLYEALTGRCPFEGGPMQVLFAKQHQVPPAPKSLHSAVPEDLDSLCMDLLRADPSQRPPYAEILGRLKQQPASTNAALDLQVPATPFIGRKEQQAELERIYLRSRSGHGQTVLLHGESGVGKSALMRHFADHLTQTTPYMVVLSGRCYEREMVPYKAVDGIIDALSRFLRRLPEAQTAALLPRRAALLLQAFPVLTRVPVLAQSAAAPNAPVQSPDPKEQRERVFAALRELLTRLAEQRPLLLLIDDLQWTDADSLALLSDLMTPPDEPPLLLVATVRSNAEVLAKTWMDPEQRNSNIHHLQIERLGDEEALALANTLISQSDTARHLSAEHVAKETGGHPMFIDELVRYTAATGASEPARLEDALWSRIRSLPEPAQRLLRLSAVMGSPIGIKVATAAASLNADEIERSLAQLRGQRLVRATVHKIERQSGTYEPDEIEPYHDRIRETILQRLLPEDWQHCHQRLADALEQSGAPNPETLTLHCQGAGLQEKAGRYALQAAEKAAQALAFDRAAKFYMQAIELLNPSDADRRALRIKLADCLIHANRSFEGAEALVEAAHGAEPRQASSLRQRAGDQYIRAGYFKQGMVLCRQAAQDLNLTLHTNTWVRLAYTLVCRLCLMIRGLRFRERSESEISAEELARIDLLLGFSNGIGTYDPVFGFYCTARGLLMLLSSGEVSRITIWLIFEAISVSISGSESAWKKGQYLLDTSRTLMARAPSPFASALLLHAEAMIHHCAGNWRRAKELFEQAEAGFLERCSGVSNELGTLRMLAFSNASFLGNLKHITSQLPRYIRDAEARSDLHQAVMLGVTQIPTLHLIHDEPERSRHEAAEWLNRWTYPGDGLPRIHVYWKQIDCLLYEGAANSAYRQYKKGLSGSNRFIIRFVQVMRIIDTDLHGRCALATARQSSPQSSPPPKTLLQETRRSIRLLERERRPWADALAQALRAGLVLIEGDRAAACEQLQRAAQAFDAADMKIHAAVARRRHGQLSGGAEGHAEVAAAEQLMSEEGIVNPARWSRMLTPSFPD